MTRIKLAILMAFMLAVAGCGGSGVLRSETSARQVEAAAEADTVPAALIQPAISQDDPPTEEDALVEERQQAEQAITGAEAEAARRQAAADMAAQQAGLATTPDAAAARISYVPYASAGTHTEFDGQGVRVHLSDYYRGSPAVLSSVLDEVDSTAVASRLAGHSRRTWTMFGDGRLAVVSVRWNDGDDSDYLAAGWWVRETPYGSEVEAGAFVDGPELRGALPDRMTLPLSGQAIYYGEAAGIYQTRNDVLCTAFPCDVPTSAGDAGEFVADAKLVADFTRGDIEGCVGCRQGIQFTSAVSDLDDGAIERGDTVTRDYLFWLHRAGFLESPYTLGAFAGGLTVAPLGGRAAGYGFWQGRFSNLADSVGSPRLLGATLQGEFEDESTTTRFSGVLSAESTTFGGRR